MRRVGPARVLDKDVELPDGSEMHYRMVQKVYIDGTLSIASGMERRRRAVGQGPGGRGRGRWLSGGDGRGGPQGTGGQQRPETGGPGGNGIKAQVQVELGSGEHVILPGAVTFTLNDAKDASSSNPCVSIEKNDAVSVLCHAVDLDSCRSASERNRWKSEPRAAGRLCSPIASTS